MVVIWPMKPGNSQRDGRTRSVHRDLSNRQASSLHFSPWRCITDAKVVAIGLKDAYFLGVLSSRFDVVWSTAIGSWLGVGNDPNYNHSDCFGKFPFPDADQVIRSRIRDLGERLDAHRKRQQAIHSALTLTAIYNTLERLNSGAELSIQRPRCLSGWSCGNAA